MLMSGANFTPETYYKRTNGKKLPTNNRQTIATKKMKFCNFGGLTSRGLFWTIIVVVVCVLCAYLIRKTYLKWQNSPVVMAFATIERTISSIPFPAVTICPEAKFNPDIFNLTGIIMKKRSGAALSAKEVEHVQLSYMVCRNFMKYSNFFSTFTLSPDDASDRLLEMMPIFEDRNITEIKWNEKPLNFSDAFDLTVTTQGVCYTFNMMDYEDMLRNGNMFKRLKKSPHTLRKFSINGGYKTGKDEGEYPRRTFTPGLAGGLTIDSLYTNGSHLDDLCEGSLQGFKVAIHSVCELPNMDKHIKLPLNQVVNVAIKPSVVVVSKELQQYSPKERKCYFFFEKFLATYKVYTQQNCMAECLANFTRARCGCIPFYSPPFAEPTEVCGPGSFKCVLYSKLKYLEMGQQEGDLCDCLPACFTLLYNVVTSHMDWNWKQVFDTLEKLGNTHYNYKALKDGHLSSLNVYYKDLQLRTVQRNELIGSQDFVSGVGGLLGLFIGFSVTSAIEILYFFTLRIICNVRMYGQSAWSGNSPASNASE